MTYLGGAFLACCAFSWPSIASFAFDAGGAAAPSVYWTTTLYLPRRAPSFWAEVVSWKFPSGPVWPLAWRPPAPSGMNSTTAPATGFPSRVTVPRTGTGELPPHPAPISRARPSAPPRLRTRMVDVLREPRPGGCRPGAGGSGQGDRLAVVPGAEVLVGAVVDALVDEPDRPVGEAEVGPAGVVRLEPPGHVPVPQAVRRVDPQRGATGVAIAPTGPDPLAVDRVVDRLDRLPLADGVVPGPAPAVAEPLELVLLDERLAQEDRVGRAVGDRGDVDPGAAHRAGPAAHHPAAVGGGAGRPVDRAGAVPVVGGRGERERHPVGPLAADLAVAVELERVGPGAARAVVALRPLRPDVVGVRRVVRVVPVAGAAGERELLGQQPGCDRRLHVPVGVRVGPAAGRDGHHLVVQGGLLHVRQADEHPAAGVVAPRPGVAPRERLVGVVVGVHGEAELLEVVHALGAGGGLAHLLDGGEEQADEDR